MTQDHDNASYVHIFLFHLAYLTLAQGLESEGKRLFEQHI